MKKLLFLFVVVSTVFVSCRFMGGKRVRGNGNFKTEERNVSGFNKVEVHGALDVYVSQGPLRPVIIEGDENLLSYVEVVQHGDKLIVKSRDGYNLQPSGDMKVHVTAPTYKSIAVSGACDIIGENKLTNSDNLKLEVSGAGDIRMEVDAPELGAEISGSGSVDLKGETRSFDLALSGAGKARCYELLSENTKVDISGAGSAEVYASRKLDAEVSGAGSISYKGDASQVNQQVSGAGSVRRSE